MIIKKGFLEILKMADGSEPRRFDDFTKISITRRLSSATISKRLDELVKAQALEEIVSRSKTGRRIIAYKTTEKGKNVIKMAKKLEDAVTISSSG
jgi:DNA-binding HxlR family transcriptional regulator